MFLVAAERSEAAGSILRMCLLAVILQIENCKLKIANCFELASGWWFRRIALETVPPQQEGLSTCRSKTASSRDFRIHRQFAICNLQFSICNLFGCGHAALGSLSRFPSSCPCRLSVLFLSLRPHRDDDDQGLEHFRIVGRYVVHVER